MHVSAYFALGISLASNSCCLSSNIHSQFLINRINGTSRNMVIVSHQHELFGIHLFAELHHYTSHAYACIKCIRALALYIERNNFYYVIISVQKKRGMGCNIFFNTGIYIVCCGWLLKIWCDFVTEYL